MTSCLSAPVVGEKVGGSQTRVADTTLPAPAWAFVNGERVNSGAPMIAAWALPTAARVTTSVRASSAER